MQQQEGNFPCKLVLLSTTIQLTVYLSTFKILKLKQPL